VNNSDPIVSTAARSDPSSHQLWFWLRMACVVDDAP
jgi:hypothetical protein